jgi:hypothetical protein
MPLPNPVRLRDGLSWLRLTAGWARASPRACRVSVGPRWKTGSRGAGQRRHAASTRPATSSHSGLIPGSVSPIRETRPNIPLHLAGQGHREVIGRMVVASESDTNGGGSTPRRGAVDVGLGTEPCRCGPDTTHPVLDVYRYFTDSPSSGRGAQGLRGRDLAADPRGGRRRCGRCRKPWSIPCGRDRR